MADNDGYVDVSFAQDGGVMKKILKEAPEGPLGPPPNGNEVEAHYTGMCFLLVKKMSLLLLLFVLSFVVR